MLTAALHALLLQLAPLQSAKLLYLSTFLLSKAVITPPAARSPEPCQELVLILSQSPPATRGGISAGTA